jgi:hypothetical protein
MYVSVLSYFYNSTSGPFPHRLGCIIFGTVRDQRFGHTNIFIKKM